MPDSADNLPELAARIAELEKERALVLRLARTDSLTGLLNRGAFTAALYEQLLKAQVSGRPMALFLVDLDRFKHLNDSLGHHAGDLLLAEVGQRLQADCGPGETVARLGGDEFALISDVENIGRRAQRIVDIMAQPLSIYGRVVVPGASVGVAAFPADARDAGELQRFADMALYRVKTHGGRRWSAFDDELREEAERSLILEADLRRAIVDGEIEPWFQPVYDVRDGRITGVEVLARWRHPDQGLLLPETFVPMAVELGLIGRIDEAVFQTACAIATPWVCDGLIETVSVNLSTRDLRDPAFARKLLARLGRTALPARALVVEVPEAHLLQDLALTRRHIQRLAANGVSVTLDNFGAGYSNLRSLTNLAISTLKLDRTLIADLGRDAQVSKLVGGLLHTAQSLGLAVIAEGIETEAQALLLRAGGCHRMQGYWFARPMPAAELEASLRSPAPPHPVPAASPEQIPLRLAGFA